MKSFVLIAVAVGILASSNIGKIPPVLPQVMDDLSLTLVEGGWVASAFFAPSVLIGIVVGAFGDAIGHKRALLIGISLLFIGGLIGVVSIGLSSLILSRVIEGLGFVTVVVSAPALIVQLTSGANQRLALGFWGAYMPSGLAIIFVFSTLFTDPLGWRGLWGFLILIAVIFIILIFKTKIPNRSGNNEDSSQTHLSEHIRLTLRNRGPWLLFWCFFFYAAQWSVIMTWFPSFLIEERGIGIFPTSLLSAVIVAANIPGNLLGAWFLKLNTPRVYLMAFAGITQAFAAFVIFSSSMPDILRYCSCILFSGVGGLIPASLMAAVAKFAPTQAQVGTTNGLMVQGSNLGHLLAPPIVAVIVAASGFWEDALILMVGAAMLNVCLSILIGAWERSISFKG